MSHEHYFIDVSAYDRVDVYRLIELAGITCPVAQHVFKKAFATGKRGHKDLRRDWQDIADSAARRLQMISEDEATFGQQNTIDCRTEAEKAEQEPRSEFEKSLDEAQAAVEALGKWKDPRTVVGLNVAFDTERQLNFAPERCECHQCIKDNRLGGDVPLYFQKMIVCPQCGNKRCPRANDHRNECTESNEPGQPGSAYP